MSLLRAHETGSYSTVSKMMSRQVCKIHQIDEIEELLKEAVVFLACI